MKKKDIWVWTTKILEKYSVKFAYDKLQDTGEMWGYLENFGRSGQCPLLKSFHRGWLSTNWSLRLTSIKREFRWITYYVSCLSRKWNNMLGVEELFPREIVEYLFLVKMFNTCLGEVLKLVLVKTLKWFA